MLGFLLMFTWSRDVYAYFVYIWMTSSFPGNRPNETISWLKTLLDSKLRVFRGFDKLFSVSGFETMAKRPETIWANPH